MPDEQGYPAFEGLEAIMQERKERLIALQQFHAQILAAHLKHLQTGDYTALGIAAQDALLELERRES